MRVLVTGGAGFIGSYLVPKLLERGDEVTVFDLSAEPKALAPVKDRIGYIRGDLGSPPDLYRAMMSCRPEGVFHLGAILAGPCDENPVRGYQVNFGSTQTLLDAAAALKTRKFFMVSSISVFGRDAKEPVPDDAAKNPELIYGQTKLASEHLLNWYARRQGVETCALRFTWVFGPGRTTGITALYSSLILDAVARGETITVPNPDERGDWLYVKDAVKAILLVWDQPSLRQRVYNIAGGVHSIRDVVQIAQRLRPGAQVILQEGGGSLSPYPVAYDDRRAREDLGWQPDYTIEAAVSEHMREVAGRSA
jgi:UDP-glucose 4-epimerase